MGLDIFANLQLGFFVDNENFYEKVKVKAFNHGFPESMKFCPQTGKELWEFEERTPTSLIEIKSYEEDWTKDSKYFIFNWEDYDNQIAVCSKEFRKMIEKEYDNRLTNEYIKYDNLSKIKELAQKMTDDLKHFKFFSEVKLLGCPYLC